jgi:transposase
MKIVGCDFHPSWQQVAVFDPQTGEMAELKLVNGDGEAERFYRELEAPALVGIEACGNSQWFIELLERLGHLVWVGDAAQIRAGAACPELAEGCAGRRRTGAMQDTFCGC